MKKLLYLLIFTLVSINQVFGETYYFKGCKLSNAVIADYTINIKKKKIDVDLKAIDGGVQNFSDKIKLIEKEQIVSEKIKSRKGEKIYYQYFLNSKSKSVIKLEFEKETGGDMDIFRLVQKKETYCLNVKSGWDKKKIEQAKASEEEKQILKAQEQMEKEQNSLIECQGNDREQWTNCTGKFVATTGHKYSGLFQNGKIVKGTSLYPGGAIYFGVFINQKPHGFGTFVWTNGDKYYGEWKNGKSHGTGTKIWNDGREYSGNFKEDKLHGEGTLYYPDGKKYVGQFISGKRHGRGTFTYSDGTAFIGKFVQGKQEGLGECVGIDGSTVTCASKAEIQSKDFSGKDTRNISIVAKKWIRISQYEENTKKGKKIMDKLKTSFETQALELCSPKANYKVLDKKLEVLEIDETPAYGLETVVRVGINGVVECI